MPTGEVDTFPIAAAILNSGTDHCILFRYSRYSRIENNLNPREESVRPESGSHTLGRYGPAQDLRRGGPKLVAEWRMGDQRADVSVLRGAENDGSVLHDHSLFCIYEMLTDL
jgi:hypothetical protein